MSVIKPSDSSIPRLFCEAWDGWVPRFHYCHDLIFQTHAPYALSWGLDDIAN
jgi:hypothetical protein